MLGDEIRVRSKRNLVQNREFKSEIARRDHQHARARALPYHNRAIATEEVIEELIKFAKEMSAATQRGVDLSLNDDEVAFYDALAAHNSAVKRILRKPSRQPTAAL